MSGRTMPMMSAATKYRDYQPFHRRSQYIDKLASALQVARAEREMECAALLDRLGIATVHPVRDGFQSLDLLSVLRVDGNHWTWTGPFNKSGTAVMYPHVGGKRTFHGAAKLVHEAVVGCHHQKAYHPLCGERSCVRPEHRCQHCAATR